MSSRTLPLGACAADARAETAAGSVTEELQPRMPSRTGERQRTDATFDTAAVSAEKTRGIVTAHANALLWASVESVHRRVTELSPSVLRQFAGAVLLASAQPHVTLLFVCIAALCVRAWSTTDASSPVAEAVMLAAAVVVSVLLDAVTHTRRLLDLTGKFTALMQHPVTGRSGTDGHVEGLAGLRGADSCSVVIVLREARDATLSLTWQRQVKMKRADGASLLAQDPDDVRMDVSEFLASPGSAHSVLAPDVCVEFELVFSDDVTLPPLKELSLPVSAGSECLLLTVDLRRDGAQLPPPVPGGDGERWVHVEVGSASLHLDRECGTSPTLDPTRLSFDSGSRVPQSLALRQLNMVRRRWRWLSLPRALSVCDRDFEMDTRKMMVQMVGEQCLAASLMRGFLMDAPEPVAKLQSGEMQRMGSPGVGPSPFLLTGVSLPPLIRHVRQSPSVRLPSPLITPPEWQGGLSPATSHASLDEPPEQLACSEAVSDDMLERTVGSPVVRERASADSGVDTDDDATDAEVRGLAVGTTRPTSTQSMMFLTQRMLAIFSIAATAVLVAAAAVRMAVGSAGGWKWYELAVEAPVCLCVASVPIATTAVHKVLDSFNNAWMSSMIMAQNSVLGVRASDGSPPRAGPLPTPRAPQRPSVDSHFGNDDDTVSSVSSESSGASLVAEGEVLNASGRAVGDLHLGVYEEDLAGKEPPSDSLEDSGLNLESLPHPTIDRRMILAHMWSLMRGSRESVKGEPGELMRGRYDLPYSRNASQVLGSLTTLCCVNKTGILSDVVPVAEVLLVMRKKEPGFDEQPFTEDQQSLAARRGSRDERMGAEEWRELHPTAAKERTGEQRRYHEQAFLTFDLLPDTSSTTLLQFADADWQNHLSKLKPLGLTAALHCLQHLEEDVCNMDARPRRKKRWDRRADTPSMRAQLHFDDTILWGKYLYFLAREIGFSEQLLNAAGYRVVKRIHTLRPMDDSGGGPQNMTARAFTSRQYYERVEGRQQMASLVVVDPDGDWQLMSIGDPQFLLDYTKEYWDGEGVCTLASSDRNELMFLSNQWKRQRDRDTIAFACRPIPKRYQEFLTKSADGSTVHVLETPEMARMAHSLSMTRLSGMVTDDTDAQSTDDEDLKNSTFSDSDQMYLRLQRKQTFLGMVGLRFPPKHMVQGIITQFKEAGIRFMQFNRDNERMTKAFGEKLGVWTTSNDWNCCISLRSRGAWLDPRDIKARLPHGIAGIRKHLVNTDNVPLIVPLFCDARAVTTRKMIDILRESHEVVGCIGSCLTHTSSLSFMHADIGLAAVPTCNTKLMHRNRALAVSRLTLFGLPGCPVAKELKSVDAHVAAKKQFADSLNVLFQLGALVSLPAAVTLPPTEYPLYFTLCLIKQARLLLHATLKVTEAMISCAMCWALCVLISALAAFPPPLTVGHMVWQIYVILPCLSVGLHQPFEALLCKRVMSIHANKNERRVHLQVIGHMAAWWAFRYPPTCVAIMATFALTLIHNTGASFSDLLPPDAELMGRPQYRAGLHHAQHTTLVAATLFFGMHALGSMSRHQSLKLFELTEPDAGKFRRPRCAAPRMVYQRRKQVNQEHFNPRDWPGFCKLIVLTFLLQIAFYLVGTTVGCPEPDFSGKVPSHVWGLLGGYSVFIILMDNFWKTRRRDAYKREQQWRRIQFDTRLGMHSPCGYDIGDGDKGLEKETLEGPELVWARWPFYST